MSNSLALFIESNVPLLIPSQKAKIISASLIMSVFLIMPAERPKLFQSGLIIFFNILYLSAKSSARVSAPSAPPEIIISISAIFILFKLVLFLFIVTHFDLR